MKVINLDGATWSTESDFYQDLLLALGAPADHDRNMGALVASIGSNDINQARLPYVIEVAGISEMSAEARQVVEDFRTMVHGLQSKGVAVRANVLTAHFAAF